MGVEDGVVADEDALLMVDDDDARHKRELRRIRGLR